MALPWTSDEVTANGQSNVFRGTGVYGMSVTGTFGGGTAQLQFSADDGVSWENLADGTGTAVFTKEVVAPRGGLFRVDLTGATAPSVFLRVGVSEQL